MIVCELCTYYSASATCELELKIPKGMSCREFCPGMQKFFDNPKDFVDSNQVIGMAKFFGMKGTELKRVKLMAERAEYTLV
jgi:hypothetical protein